MILAFLMCGISFYILEKDQNGISKPMIYYSLAATVVVIGITWILINIFQGNNMVFYLKRVCLLCVLWPIAYTDIKEYRIPNKFIALGLIYRILIVFVELWMGEPIVASLISELAAAGILLVATGLCRLCIKNAIGAGDMKLFIVMGLLLGLEGMWSAVFLSLIVSFFIAVFVLVTKKKSRNDNIPFGPAITLGTYLSIMLMGM